MITIVFYMFKNLRDMEDVKIIRFLEMKSQISELKNALKEINDRLSIEKKRLMYLKTATEGIKNKT